MYKILFITNYKRDNQYSMERYSKTHINLLKDLKDFKIDVCPISNIFLKNSENKLIRFLNKYILFPIYIFFKSLNYQIVHISDNGNAYLNLFVIRKSIITCHDLIPYKFPKSNLKNRIYRFLNKTGMLMSQCIIADSKSTKKDFLKIITKKKKLEYIYPPYIQKKYFFKKKIKQSKYRFIVHIGSIDYKNRLMALNIINDLKRYNYKLICIGKLKYDEKKFIDKNQLTSIVIEKYNISEKQKLEIIKKANIILLTSKYEGYGFPVLEGYSQDTLVVSSNKGSLKELVSEIALVKKYDCKNFVHKIRQFENNSKINKKLIKINNKILNNINDINSYRTFYKRVYQI